MLRPNKILIIICILIMLIISIFIVRNNKIPSNIGMKNGMFSDLPTTPNAISTQTDVESKKIDVFIFKEDLEKSKLLILEILVNYEGAEIIIEKSNYIHIVFSTKKMKFKDDVEFYFDEENEVIHYRSASRVGCSDMGINLERYNIIRDKYNK